MTTEPHPFAHLGPAPYRFVGLQTTEDRQEMNARLEAAGLTFTTNMCGGSCDHCGTAIWNVYTFEAADGTRFKVGETCAEKAGEGEAAKEGKKAHVRERRERASKAARLAMLEAERDRNEAAGLGRYTDRELADMRAKAAEQARREKIARSRHQWTVGERVKDCVLRYEGHYAWASDYRYGEVVTLFFLRTLDGHAVVWRTTGGLDVYRKAADGSYDLDSEILQGTCFRASFTVKRHGTYDRTGEQQTEVTRLMQSTPKAPRAKKAAAA